MMTEPNRRHPEAITVETALRHLGTRNHGLPESLIKYAIDRPLSGTGQSLAPLTLPTSALADWTSEQRASALWQVIQEGVADPDVGPTQQSRRRRALHAALRLTDVDIKEKWGASLTDRFRQLRVLREVFGEPTRTSPRSAPGSMSISIIMASRPARRCTAINYRSVA